MTAKTKQSQAVIDLPDDLDWPDDLAEPVVSTPEPTRETSAYSAGNVSETSLAAPENRARQPEFRKERLAESGKGLSRDGAESRIWSEPEVRVMQILLDASHAAVTIAEKAAAAGVSEATWRELTRDRELMAEVKDAALAVHGEQLPAVLDAVAQVARSPKPEAFRQQKLYLDRVLGPIALQVAHTHTHQLSQRLTAAAARREARLRSPVVDLEPMADAQVGLE